jgi:peptidoglycan/LPS O-acetylase OafA/YrhL
MKKLVNIRSNLPLLHSVRGVAALYVVVAHAKFILWSGGREYLNQYPKSGWNVLDYFNYSIDMMFGAAVQMVMIFFVLSGFFIAMSLSKLDGSMLQKLRTFYCVRIIRIYIPYIASIIVSVLVLFSVVHLLPDLFQLHSAREFNNNLILSNNNLTFSNFVKSLIFSKNEVYIGGNLVYWSLLYEGVFYLVIPFVYLIKKQYLIISTVLFIAGIFSSSISHTANIFVGFVFQYNFYFALGVGLFVYKEKISNFILFRNLKMPLIVSSFLLFLIFDVLALLKLVFWADLLAAITTVLLISLFLNYDIADNFIMRRLKSLGRISYSLYVIHFPMLIILYACIYKITGKIFFYTHLYYPIGVLFSIIAALGFFKIVEEPSLKLIRRVKTSLKKREERGNLNLIVEKLNPLPLK